MQVFYCLSLAVSGVKPLFPHDFHTKQPSSHSYAAANSINITTRRRYLLNKRTSRWYVPLASGVLLEVYVVMGVLGLAVLLGDEDKFHGHE